MLPDVDGLYFGGGYPELHAAQLSANRHLLDDVRTNADDGMPIYGECGGLTYLSRSLSTVENKRVPLANILPVDVQMTQKRQALGHAKWKPSEIVRSHAPVIRSAATNIITRPH